MNNLNSSGCKTHKEMYPMTNTSKAVSKSIAHECVDVALQIGA